MVSVYKFLTVPKNGFRSMDEVINCMVLRLHFDCVHKNEFCYLNQNV